MYISVVKKGNFSLYTTIIITKTAKSYAGRTKSILSMFLTLTTEPWSVRLLPPDDLLPAVLSLLPPLGAGHAQLAVG